MRQILSVKKTLWCGVYIGCGVMPYIYKNIYNIRSTLSTQNDATNKENYSTSLISTALATSIR